MATRKATPSLARQQWLEKATLACRKLFTAKGYTVPANVRVSIGWPKGGRKRIGECWGDGSSSDKHHELFISPEITHARNGARVLDVLAHELAHAVVGTREGHGKVFKRCALAIGLAGKMKATVAGPEFSAWASGVLKSIGPIPAGSLAQMERPEKKQSTRLLKCACVDCGYTVRTTRKWIEAGLPICPTDDQPMICASFDDSGREI